MVLEYPDYRSTSVNECEVTLILSKNPERQILVQRVDTGAVYRLCLNSQGQLCYLEGNNKKLFPVNSRNFVMHADGQLSTPENCPPQVTVADEAPVPQATAMDLHQFIRGFNAFVEHTARVREDAPVVRKAKDPEFVETLQANFRVVVPADYQLETLAVKYIVAITNSITDLKNDVLPKTNYRVGKLETVGFIKDVPGLLQIILDGLDQAGFGYSYVQTGGAYLRFTVWLEYE